MLGQFVTEATLTRVSELLQLSEEEAEEALADACSDGMLWLRMDRVKRIVVFKQPKRAESVLTDWTSDVKGIMDGLDKIVYLIEKERMVKEVNSRVSCKQDYRTMLTELPSLRDKLNSHCVTN